MASDLERMKAVAKLRSMCVMIRNPALRHCGEPTLLVHSMKGGFVNSNCTVCGHRGGLTKKALREAIDIPVKCPICKQRMAAEKVEKPKLKNYYIACGDCRFKVLLGDMLPDWRTLEAVIKGNGLGLK